ncbi:uncharacterized protein LOC117787269 [Drosophila innubila]|uniref:uncharacterized protein LOC117787269 n=1 Tax=Drosophila innubila TaxID=198719 RepID=UPI00148DE5D8|nr:uncharacterized protein LOC117787269 [Drosophila innubila]
MSLRKSAESASTIKNYTIISRWMYKTLNDWRFALKLNGSDVLVYEEYIDFTTNADYFEKFMLILGQYCPNLMHVRLFFSGHKNDTLEEDLLKSVLRLPNVQCLSLFDAPKIAFTELKDDFNQLTTLKLSGIDEKISIDCFADILGSMEKLHSLAYHYKNPEEKFVAALTNLTKLKALSLLYAPGPELKQLKNCNQLEILHLYNINENMSTDDFLDIFKSMANLHTLSSNFFEENSHLAGDLNKLNACCPQLTYLTLNRNLNSYGKLVNLKYMKFDMDDNNLSIEELMRMLVPYYADRLQILDISTSPKHSHTMEITKLKRLKAFLCWSWPSNLFKCLSEIADLQLFSLETDEDNLIENDAITNMIKISKNLKYLRLPLKNKKVEELVLALPDVLNRRKFKPDNPFVLSLIGKIEVPEIEQKLKALPHGDLLQLDWNGKIFASKLKDIIASLQSSQKIIVNNIYQNPCKMAGDRLQPDDHWMSNMNYKIALKSCSNKFNLEYDEMLINRCRDMSINNADYELLNMIFAFNFKYEALDTYNEC